MQGMAAFAIKRLLLLPPVLLGVSIISFMLLHITPGDPVLVMLGESAAPGQVEALREELGLNAPLPVQYARYLTRIIQGDLGRSIWTRSPVLSEILLRLPATIELTLASMLIAIPIGFHLGVFSATNRNASVDHAVRLFSLSGVSVPVFWSGLMLQLVFAMYLGWLPVSGRVDSWAEPSRVTGFYILDSLLTGNSASSVSCIRHIVLPAVAQSLMTLALVSRMTRSSMLEVLWEDYIRTARAKGLSEQVVVYKHALRNALIPTITVIGIHFAWMLGGSVLVEVVFSWPGIGRLMFESITKRDYPVVQGNLLVYAAIFLLSSLVVDLLYAYIDPRIRHYKR